MDITNPWYALAVAVVIALTALSGLWVRAAFRAACPKCRFPKYRCTCEDDHASDVLEA